MSPRQLSWNVNGLHLQGLAWGEPAQPPLLALHGWLDNAASFERLAPLLAGRYVVALDLTGHGQSSWRSQDATYQIWDDLPEILGVLEQLGWQNFDLLGHSRGAIICTILASAIPGRVNHLILLDAVSPHAVPESEFPRQLARFLRDKPRRLGREPRVYTTRAEAIEARSKKGLSLGAAGALASRGLAHKSEGYVWASDPRLYGASAVKLTEGQNRAILHGLTMPTLFLQAQNGLAQGAEMLEHAKSHVHNFSGQIVPGGHHFHMEDSASIIAHTIAEFIQ